MPWRPSRPSVEELIHYQSQLSIAAGQGIMVVAALVALSALGTLSALVLIQLYNRRISRRIDAGLSKLSNQMRSQGASDPESGLSDPLPELARQGVAALLAMKRAMARSAQAATLLATTPAIHRTWRWLCF